MQMKLIALLVAGGLWLLTATPAFAAPEEGGGGLLTPEGGLMVWTLVVFGIVLFVLWKFAYPHILGAVEAREARLTELMAAAERDRDEARALLEQQQQEHEVLRGQAQEIMADARATGERLREEVLAEARREHEALLARARRDIAVERENAVDEMRRDTVELAIAAAERLIRANLDDEANRELVRRFLAEAGESRATAGV
jgi:F-type H+-transporting ATPase subunit b